MYVSEIFENYRSSPLPNFIYSETIIRFNKTDTERYSARLPFHFDSRIEIAILQTSRLSINPRSEKRKRAKTGRRESNYPSHYYESATVHSFRSPGGPEDDERIHLEGRRAKGGNWFSLDSKLEVRNAQTNRKIIRRVVERAGAMINTLLADRAFSSLPPLLPSSRVHVHEISVVKRITTNLRARLRAERCRSSALLGGYRWIN